MYVAIIAVWRSIRTVCWHFSTVELNPASAERCSMGSFVETPLLPPDSAHDQKLRQPTSPNLWLEKFQCSSKFTKTTAGWPDGVKQWKIHVGSKLKLWTLLAHSISFPVSRLPCVLHTTEERVSDNFYQMVAMIRNHANISLRFLHRQIIGRCW